MEQSTMYLPLIIALIVGILWAVIYELRSNYKEPSQGVVVNEYTSTQK